MKVVILAGGYGTRISEESYLRPKPMIEIGGRPILWHIMKEYSYFGFNEFIICCGYKQHMVKEYFADYYLHNSDVTFDFRKENEMIVHNNVAEPWRVTLIDTGLGTMTGGRVKRVENYIGKETFLLTYGDGVGDIPINKVVEYHRSHGRIATLTAAPMMQRFGILDIREGNTVHSFKEKPQETDSRINIGYMVLEPQIFSYIEGDGTVLEGELLENLARMGELKVFFHEGFWQCMDTKREMDKLEELWESGKAPWKVWDR